MDVCFGIVIKALTNIVCVILCCHADKNEHIDEFYANKQHRNCRFNILPTHLILESIVSWKAIASSLASLDSYLLSCRLALSLMKPDCEFERTHFVPFPKLPRLCSFPGWIEQEYFQPYFWTFWRPTATPPPCLASKGIRQDFCLFLFFVFLIWCIYLFIRVHLSIIWILLISRLRQFMLIAWDGSRMIASTCGWAVVLGEARMLILRRPKN